MQDSVGFLYIATGQEFVQEAIRSAKTVSKNHENIPIGLITDQHVDHPVFDDLMMIDSPEYGFEDQILHLKDTPYNLTIYLDSDIYMDGSVRSVFKLLDNFDIGLVHSHSREAWPLEDVPEAFPAYNSGVMAYKCNDAFLKFLSLWEDIYYMQKEADEELRNQPSLRKALYKSNVRIATLYPEYNLLFRYPGHAVKKIKVFHGRLQPVDSPGAGQYFDVEEAVEVINQTEGHRVFTQLGGITLHTNKEDSLLHRARLSYRMHGPKHVVVEGIELLKKKFGNLL